MNKENSSNEINSVKFGDIFQTKNGLRFITWRLWEDDVVCVAPIMEGQPFGLCYKLNCDYVHIDMTFTLPVEWLKDGIHSIGHIDLTEEDQELMLQMQRYHFGSVKDLPNDERCINKVIQSVDHDLIKLQKELLMKINVVCDVFAFWFEDESINWKEFLV